MTLSDDPNDLSDSTSDEVASSCGSSDDEPTVSPRPLPKKKQMSNKSLKHKQASSKNAPSDSYSSSEEDTHYRSQFGGVKPSTSKSDKNGKGSDGKHTFLS